MDAKNFEKLVSLYETLKEKVRKIQIQLDAADEGLRGVDGGDDEDATRAKIAERALGRIRGILSP